MSLRIFLRTRAGQQRMRSSTSRRPAHLCDPKVDLCEDWRGQCRKAEDSIDLAAPERPCAEVDVVDVKKLRTLLTLCGARVSVCGDGLLATYWCNPLLSGNMPVCLKRGDPTKWVASFRSPVESPKLGPLKKRHPHGQISHSEAGCPF